jgi:uncharacterized membrane protein
MSKQGGYSPAVAPQTKLAYDDYSGDPNAPAWLKGEMGMQPKANWVEPMPPITGHTAGASCCSKFGLKALSCLVYFFGIISAIICLFVEKHNAYLLANAWQCLFVSIPCIVICLFFAWTAIGSTILWSAYGVVLLALIIATLVTPYPNIFRVPIVGNWAVKRADYTVMHHAHEHHEVTETTTIRQQHQYSTI